MVRTGELADLVVVVSTEPVDERFDFCDATERIVAVVVACQSRAAANVRQAGQAIGSVESEVGFRDRVARPGALKPVDAGALRKCIVSEGDPLCCDGRSHRFDPAELAW